MNCTILQKLVVAQCRRNIKCNIYHKFRNFSMTSQKKIVIPVKCSIKVNVYICNRLFYNKAQHFKNVVTNKKGIEENISMLQLKKRLLRKKNVIAGEEASTVPGVWTIKALATAEQYNLEGLEAGLLSQQLYEPRKICTSTNRK
ncbi:hypothetical protein KPH14_007231 [Odynerus spinipes]|uniref:Uncharacterized protein n=1 Tax=Odynerus spinipes TaxID=1348599 RepID=A0AAD9R9V2_9HYME|nr:hypothetical protein KPH14_007231 [Odynerus spinipes]